MTALLLSICRNSLHLVVGESEEASYSLCYLHGLRWNFCSLVGSSKIFKFQRPMFGPSCAIAWPGPSNKKMDRACPFPIISHLPRGRSLFLPRTINRLDWIGACLTPIQHDFISIHDFELEPNLLADRIGQVSSRERILGLEVIQVG